MPTILDRPTKSPVTQPPRFAVAPSLETEYERKGTPAQVNGPAMAALVAAGIGSFALGLFIVLTEAIPAVKTFMNVYNPVGPLSGKSTFAVVAYVISWGVLAYLWKGKEMNFP